MKTHLDHTADRTLQHLQTEAHDVRNRQPKKIYRNIKKENLIIRKKKEEVAVSTGGEGLNDCGSATLEISENLFDSARTIGRVRLHWEQKLEEDESGEIVIERENWRECEKER